MSNPLLDEILRAVQAIPKPDIARIIIHPTIPASHALRWNKHDGILWMNQKMLAQIVRDTVSPAEGLVVERMFGIPIEDFNEERHMDLWIEFLMDCAQRARDMIEAPPLLNVQWEHL